MKKVVTLNEDEWRDVLVALIVLKYQYQGDAKSSDISGPPDEIEKYRAHCIREALHLHTIQMYIRQQLA